MPSQKRRLSSDSLNAYSQNSMDTSGAQQKDAVNHHSAAERDTTAGQTSFVDREATVQHGDFAKSSLQDLQGEGVRKIMDLVNQLRRIGLSEKLELPQLVVCGDQSSGKSSVLEAVSQIPFPRKENLCTRFATEIVMRTDEFSSISTRIIPDKSRPKTERDNLAKFSGSIRDFSTLPDLIDKATTAMGLDSQTQHTVRAFTEDVLSIEISGPKIPQLTLVDLPGLIHSENKSQTDADVQLIRNLVERYISNKRTIILAVISAKNDYANQIILKHCRTVDPKGDRTLGIITKPDFLHPGSENEKNWIDLALNRDVYFELGWHMLKNRDDMQLHYTLEDRKAAEIIFFSKGRYKTELQPNMVGVESLRVRLSQVLARHLKKELPSLKRELETMLTATSKELSELGEERGTAMEQKQYLMRISLSLHDILKSAVHGSYERAAFGPIDMDAAIDAPANITRLRAVVQHLNLQFAARMRRCGHKFTIPAAFHEITPATDDEGEGPEDQQMAEDTEDCQSSIDGDGDGYGCGDSHADMDENETRPTRLSRNCAVEWVVSVLQRCRGSELPGTFNPLLISQLFWEQSEPWEKLALAHIDKIGDVCQEFVKRMLHEVAPQGVAANLYEVQIQAKLKSAIEASQNELARIIDDKKSHPMTYNHYFTTTLQRLRRKRHGVDLNRLAEDSKYPYTDADGNEYTAICPVSLERSLKTHIEQDMDKYSAEEALDSQIAYYKDELKYFVDVVTKQVIERHLIKSIPNQVFSPMVVANLSEQEVAALAAEPRDIVETRKRLVQNQKMLENGRDAFRLAARGAL